MDRLAVDTAPPSREVLALQHHIHGILEGAVSDDEAAQYFTDLKLITALITAAWPHSQHLIAPEFLDPVANHVRLNLDRGRHIPYSHTVLGAPLIDPLAAAGLLQASHTALTCTDLPTALTALIDRIFTPIAAKIAWSRFFNRYRTTSSRRLHQALIGHSLLAGAN